MLHRLALSLMSNCPQSSLRTLILCMSCCYIKLPSNVVVAWLVRLAVDRLHQIQQLRQPRLRIPLFRRLRLKQSLRPRRRRLTVPERSRSVARIRRLFYRKSTAYMVINTNYIYNNCNKSFIRHKMVDNSIKCYTAAKYIETSWLHHLNIELIA